MDTTDAMDTKEKPTGLTFVSFVSIVVIQRRYEELNTDPGS
jgi:hypothetical protein